MTIEIATQKKVDQIIERRKLENSVQKLIDNDQIVDYILFQTKIDRSFGFVRGFIWGVIITGLIVLII